MPRYYPVFIDVNKRRCLTIGGGNIGQEKVEKLLECDADVFVISPEVNSHVEDLASSQQISWDKREYQQGDLEGAFIAIAATDDHTVHRQVAKEAEDRANMLFAYAAATVPQVPLMPPTDSRGAYDVIS